VKQSALGQLSGPISYIVGWCTRLRLPKFLLLPILRRYVKTYQVDLDVIDRPLKDYVSVDDFFTRDLLPSARPIACCDGAVVSPADGRIHNLGWIEDGIVLQAKGVPYSLEALLADPADAALFKQGSYLTVHLSPRDCHHVFAPVTGRLRSATHVAGALFPVREPYASQRIGLYAKNERLVAQLDSDQGPVAVVMVGALNVGNMELCADPGLVGRRSGFSRRSYDGLPIAGGQKLGTFHLGSTVVLLLSKRVQWRAALQGAGILYGESLTEEPGHV
jgi:phosphatidylserine decarboxylase